MSALFNEDRQYFDEATGELLVGGKIYIGTAGLDPKTNPKNIYDNRELTGSPLGQPVIIGSDGRASSKIWLSGKYSFTVDSSADAQKYAELQNGFDEAVGNVQTTNALGINDITATGVPVQTTYVDNTTYIVTAPANNTGAMTINIDSIGVIDIRKAHDQALVSGDVKADMKLVLVYNSTDNWMELQSAVLGSAFSSIELTGTAKFAKGADIASAASLALGTDGNYFDVTGTTAITSINTVKVGTWIKLHFDAILTLTHHATDLILPGGENITTAAGDEATFIEYATGDWRCTEYQKAVAKPYGAAIATNHVRAGNDQIADGTNESSLEQAFTVDGAFRTVGPTGSGMDIIWTALDLIPANARILKVSIEVSARADTSATATIFVNAASGDVTTPIASASNRSVLTFLTHYPDTTPTTNEGTQIYIPCEIPLNSSLVFKIAATSSGSGVFSASAHYKGFITD